MNTIDAVKQILLQSGASWVLWLLSALSLLSVRIMIERWFYYRSRGAKVSPPRSGGSSRSPTPSGSSEAVRTGVTKLSPSPG